MSMSITIDVAKSEKARADGNASFKKGRWVEAIGHYTTSIISNPEDPLAYSNRAQAYLKLDKYNDAERDCTLALTISSNNVKALYRRGVARRELKKLHEAVQDFEALLKIENNENVKNELSELRELTKADENKKKKPRRPISPPAPSATIAEISDPDPEAEANVDGDKLVGKTRSINLDSSPSSAAPSPATASAPAPAPKSDSKPDNVNVSVNGNNSSFASLRKARDTRKAFVTPSNVNANTNTRPNHDRQHTSSPIVSVASTSADAITAFPTESSLLTSKTSTSAKPKDTGTNTTGPSSSTSKTSSTSEPTNNNTTTRSEDVNDDDDITFPSIDPTSQAPGAGINLLRLLAPTNKPKKNYAILSSFQPDTLIKILDGLLEPDTLGTIYTALEYGSSSSPDDAEKIINVMRELRHTKRWKMNVSMLSPNERIAAQTAWEHCGAEGSWK